MEGGGDAGRVGERGFRVCGVGGVIECFSGRCVGFIVEFLVGSICGVFPFYVCSVIIFRFSAWKLVLWHVVYLLP